jgi:transcriptional regulator with PAS, ATPase and Fis domain
LADAKLSLITDQEIERWGLPALVGRGQAMRGVVEAIRKLQPADNTTVLIRGESGTGKELVARALHYSGRRGRQPFIAVNCAAVPGDLAESLFFGHVKGAFSGAHENRKGYFEMANGGTLFLDEIGDMPLNLQAKLLRALEDGSFRPVGSPEERRADVRVLAATHVDLKNRIESGAFRKDLYFRIGGYEIELKPLRERREDLELFITHFLKKLSGELKSSPPALSPDAHRALTDYHYPGNIRELRSILERALIESAGARIEPCHLHLLTEQAPGRIQPPTAGADHPPRDLPLNLEQAEIELVRRALTRTKGNVSQAAQLLGINRTKVYRILSQSEGPPTAEPPAS